MTPLSSCGTALQALLVPPVEAYFGGLNSLASQPRASDAMGSLATTLVSTRPHFWHSKVR